MKLRESAMSGGNIDKRSLFWFAHVLACLPSTLRFADPAAGETFSRRATQSDSLIKNVAVAIAVGFKARPDVCVYPKLRPS